ncbi:hypothetical protein FNZ07_31670 [Paraburkholderia megapolitana]|nr:hypothetical protein FNZ07_31670 [Paraburkholderia megapolitana]
MRIGYMPVFALYGATDSRTGRERAHSIRCYDYGTRFQLLFKTSAVRALELEHFIQTRHPTTPPSCSSVLTADRASQHPSSHCCFPVLR